MLESSTEEQIRRKASLDGICSAYRPMNYGDFTGMFMTAMETDKVELAAPMLKQAVAMLAEETDVGNGYRIVLNAYYLYGPAEYEQAIMGLFLTLLNEAGGQVGVLGFKVGVPFHITCVQGRNGKWGSEVLDAYNATGKPFYEILAKRMFHCVGASLRFKDCEPLRGNPKIAFEFIGSENIRRHLSNYISRSKRVGFIYDDARGSAFVRPKFVSGHADAGVRAPCPQKKLIL